MPRDAWTSSEVTGAGWNHGERLSTTVRLRAHAEACRGTRAAQCLHGLAARGVSMSLFTDRRHAGRVLAAALRKLEGQPDLVVLALPRGGVPVAYEVAHALAAQLDVFVVRKLGVPGHEEFAMGA